MKVRIGFGAGAREPPTGGAVRGRSSTRSSATGSTRCGAPSAPPARCPTRWWRSSFAAGRTDKLKLGTSVQVLPGRNPVLLAKQWAAPRRAVGRAGAARVRARHRRPAWSSRRSASRARSARRGSTRRCRSIRRLWTRGRRRPRRCALPLRGCVDRPPARAAAARRVARRARAGRAAAGRPVRRRLAARASARPSRSQRDRAVVDDAAAAGRARDRPRALRRDGLLHAAADSPRPTCARSAERAASTPTT